MKTSQFQELSNLIRQRNTIKDRIVECREKLTDSENLKVNEYSGCFSQCRDGSGKPVSLSGCGVYENVLEAIYEVLEAKLVEVESEIETLGVGVDD